MRHARSDRVDGPPERRYNVNVLTIRREAADDAEAVADVQVRTWQPAYAGIMPAELLTALDRDAWAGRRRYWRAVYSDQFATLVAEADGVIVGFATIGPYRNRQDNEDVDPAYGEILAIYVAPAHWGTGVGRRLMTAALAKLTARGWHDVRLWVLEDNVRARRCYELAGLTPDGERSVYRVGDVEGSAGYELAEIRYAGHLTTD